MKARFYAAKIIRGFYTSRPFNAQAKTRSLLVHRRNAEDWQKETEKERKTERESDKGRLINLANHRIAV